MSELIEFELAKSQYQTARFREALSRFIHLAETALQCGNIHRYFEIQLYVIRILFEQDRTEEVNQAVRSVYLLIETRQDLPAGILSKCYYVLGIVRYSKHEELPLAKVYFNKAVDLAIESQDFEALAYALYGRAMSFFKAEEFDSSFADLEKLSAVLNSTDLPDLRTSVSILVGYLRRKKLDFQGAIQCFEDALESLKVNPSNYLYIQTLSALGHTYLMKKDLENAQMILELARMICPEQEMPKTAQLIRSTLQNLRDQVSQKPAFFFEFDSELGIIERKGVGQVNLNSQFILRDLLTLFLKNPETIFSKEELIEKVWAETYSPLIHDNKIYVTMKRLRKTMEPIFQDIEPVLRVRNGYCLNHVIAGQMKHEGKSL